MRQKWHVIIRFNNVRALCGQARSALAHINIGINAAIECLVKTRPDRCAGDIAIAFVIKLRLQALNSIFRTPIAICDHNNGIIKPHSFYDTALAAKRRLINGNKCAAKNRRCLHGGIDQAIRLYIYAVSQGAIGFGRNICAWKRLTNDFVFTGWFQFGRCRWGVICRLCRQFAITQALATCGMQNAIVLCRAIPR